MDNNGVWENFHLNSEKTQYVVSGNKRVVKLMIKKILVTGGAGYVGSATVRHLLSLNYEVFVIDNLLQGSEGVNCFLGYQLITLLKEI